jgi:ribonuclease-3 family protein
MDWSQQPVRALAYMGDAVYELHIRERMLREGGKVEALHKATVAHVSATGQAALARHLLPELTEDELAIFKRARNHKTAAPRRSNPADYQLGTAFEALLGYLYLKPDTERLGQILAMADSFHKEDLHAT